MKTKELVFYTPEYNLLLIVHAGIKGRWFKGWVSDGSRTYPTCFVYIGEL